MLRGSSGGAPWVAALLGLFASEACQPAPVAPVPVVLDRSLVVEAWVAHRFAARDASRYLAVLRVPRSFAHFEDEHWLVAKNGSWPNAATGSRLVAFSGCDGRLRDGAKKSKSCLRGSGVDILAGARETHNFALRFEGDLALWGVSGLTSPRHPATLFLYGANRSAALSRTSLVAPEDDTWYPRLGSRAKGCVEKRPDHGGHCEYDGRFSLAALGDKVLLYARANTNPRGGGRHVQVASTPRRTDVTRGSKRPKWSTFAPLRFARGAPEPFGVLADAAASTAAVDIYYAAVEANPSDGGKTVLGLFPTVVSRDSGGAAAILAAVSCDGAHFSRPFPLVNSSHVGGEIVDHVVDGIALDGDDAVLFVHRGVPGTAEKACAYKALFPKAGEKGKALSRGDAKWRPPRSEVLALRVPLAGLRDFTRRGVAGLRKWGRCPKRRESRDGR